MADRQIHISDENSRNAMINFKGNPVAKKTMYVDSFKEPVRTQKYVKSTSAEAYNELLKNYDDENAFAKALLAEDPEINLNMVGRYLSQSTRVYVNEDYEIVFKIKKEEKVYNAQGELIEEREPRHLDSNINSETPLKWSGKKFPKSKAFNQFIFIRKYQLKHTNGLTFDMLYKIAKELHEENALMLIGSGKGTGPVVFQDGGKPFRVFLEGRVKGDQYLLIMHLSNQELKPLQQD